MLSLKKHPLFDYDLETAALWYGQRNPASAERLIDDTALTIRTIMADPLQFWVWAGETRRIRLRRFPYLVFTNSPMRRCISWPSPTVRGICRHSCKNGVPPVKIQTRLLLF